MPNYKVTFKIPSIISSTFEIEAGTEELAHHKGFAYLFKEPDDDGELLEPVHFNIDPLIEGVQVETDIIPESQEV